MKGLNLVWCCVEKVQQLSKMGEICWSGDVFGQEVWVTAVDSFHFWIEDPQLGLKIPNIQHGHKMRSAHVGLARELGMSIPATAI